MQRKPFTNTHIHIFNTDCAPERFFRILSTPWLNPVAGLTKALLDSPSGRKAIGFFYTFAQKTSQKKWARLVSFIHAGSRNSQLEIFRMALEAGRLHDPSIRLVGLTLNMDFMDSKKSIRKSFETQLEEVRDIKRYYPDQFFPFLGIDPRHKSGMELKEWAEENLSSGFLRAGKPYPYFYGFKIYPAQGFFPFDPRLEEFYAYAEAYDLPVTTHCTRSGSTYIGNDIEAFLPKRPRMILPQGNPAAEMAREAIYARIQRYYAAQKVKNNRFGLNGAACDLFSHPQNYVPVLEAFPKLKLCLAHMGGSSEFLDQPESEEVKQLRELEDKRKWLDHIRDMMKIYPRLFADISYTLSDFDKAEILDALIPFLEEKDREGNLLGKRILFGTDFFMTEQEKKEKSTYAALLENERLAPWLSDFTRDNPAAYLSNIR